MNILETDLNPWLTEGSPYCIICGQGPDCDPEVHERYNESERRYNEWQLSLGAQMRAENKAVENQYFKH
jgi:hypothetical protein